MRSGDIQKRITPARGFLAPLRGPRWAFSFTQGQFKMLKIEKVHKDGNWFDITLDDLSGFALDTKYGAIPKIGDEVIIHYENGFGSAIRGVSLNDKVVFFKTDEQLEQERQESLLNYEKEKQQTFEKNRSQMDADYATLPDIFQRRIDKFRKTNPRFRLDYEFYELFCCKQAKIIADTFTVLAALKDNDKEDLKIKTIRTQAAQLLINWQKLDYKEQKKIMPDLSDRHSGNTFGISCRLAYTALVGYEEYACQH